MDTTVSPPVNGEGQRYCLHPHAEMIKNSHSFVHEGMQQTFCEYWLDLDLTDVISTVTSCAGPSRGHSSLGSDMNAACSS